MVKNIDFSTKERMRSKLKIVLGALVAWILQNIMQNTAAPWL